MSYILDALRKAEHERSIGDVPDLEAPHWSQRRRAPVRNWVLVVIGLIILNGVLLAMLFNHDGSDDDSPVVSGHMPRAVPGEAMGPGEALQGSDITGLQQPDSMPLKPLVRRESKVITTPRPLVNKPATVATPRSGAAASAGRPPAVKPVQTGASQIPTWNELPMDFRRGFNPPRMDVHVYDEEPSRRFILVELQRYTEGDTLGSGAKLEKILPASIQLNYQGTRFSIDR